MKKVKVGSVDEYETFMGAVIDQAAYDSIALNYGNSVDIINKSGWLEKTYTSSQQIKDLIVGDNIVGIVYKDKIEIIDF